MFHGVTIDVEFAWECERLAECQNTAYNFGKNCGVEELGGYISGLEMLGLEFREVTAIGTAGRLLILIQLHELNELTFRAEVDSDLSFGKRELLSSFAICE